MTLDVEAPRTPLARTLQALEKWAPDTLRGRLSQLRRDVAVVEGRLVVGDKPSPVVRVRGPVREAPRAVSLAPAPSVPTTNVAPVSAAPSAAPAPSPAPVATVDTTAATVTLHTESGSHRFPVKQGKYLLESALEAGAVIPFSCTLGGCGTCKVRLLSGEMELEEPNCLTPEELADGLRLCCVGRVTSSSCEVRLEPGTEA